MLKTLFNTKSLDAIKADIDRPGQHLKRTLGPVNLTLLGIGAIVGAGIFATIGTAAGGDALRPGAGPALSVSFLITAVICGFVAMCYAEFAAMVPISGSAYTYSYATLGELVAWIIGWDLIIEYAVGNIAVAISWANYFKTFVKGFGINVPDWLSMDYRTAGRIVDAAGVHTVYRDAPHIFGIPIIFNLLAAGIVFLITMILIWGIRESARFNAIMVGIKIVVLLFFVGVGLAWVKPENWTPFAPNGWAGISAGAAIVFFAYIGFDAISTTAEETRNPQRNMPIGIFASLIVCTLLYAVVAVVFTGLIPFDALKNALSTQQAEPLTMALEYANHNMVWAIGFVAFGSVVAHTAVLLVFQLGQPRIFFSMARDGLMPKVFQKVHPRYRTPYVATILTGLFVGGSAAFASLDEMVDLTNIGTLFAFIVVCAGIIVLKIKEPTRQRPFTVPSGWFLTVVFTIVLALVLYFVPLPLVDKVLLMIAGSTVFIFGRRHIIPLLGIIFCLYLIYHLPPTSWLRFAAWLNIGFLLYATYGAHHSRLTGVKEARTALIHHIRTAYTGAILGILGALLILGARLADIHHFHHVIDPRYLLHNSWWLSLPLALNAYILGPILLVRIHHIRQSSLSAVERNTLNRALVLTIGLIAVITVYLLVLLVL